MEACFLFSKGFSKCPRQQFAAIIVDDDNQVISIGYNGTVRGEPNLCGDHACQRDIDNIPSGRETDIGCVHAEENAILNCARQGVSCKGMKMYINAEPCPKCAKRIAQVGINKVLFHPTGYPFNGVPVLEELGVEVEELPYQK